MTNPDPNTHIDVTVHVEGPFARWRRRGQEKRDFHAGERARLRESKQGDKLLRTPRSDRQIKQQGSDWLP